MTKLLVKADIEITTTDIAKSIKGDPHAFSELLKSLCFSVSDGQFFNSEVWDLAIDYLDNDMKEILKKRVSKLFDKPTSNNSHSP